MGQTYIVDESTEVLTYTYKLKGGGFIPVLIFHIDTPEFKMHEYYPVNNDSIKVNINLISPYHLVWCRNSYRKYSLYPLNYSVELIQTFGSYDDDLLNVTDADTRLRVTTKSHPSAITSSTPYDQIINNQNSYTIGHQVVIYGFVDNAGNYADGHLAIADSNESSPGVSPIYQTSKGFMSDAKFIVGTMNQFAYNLGDGVEYGSTDWLNKIMGKSTKDDPGNPYDGGDDKGDDDNTPGDYDHTSDPVPEPDLPSVSVTDSGLVTLFAPTESQLKSLANYLWSDAFSLDNFKKMLNNPMDCILGLTIVPVNVPRGSAREITVGNIVTTVSCDICPTQYVKVDCGTFTFNRHDMTNSYLDYAPYSKCYLYLPFIGVQEINIDDFMQSTMHVVYHVDILTGAMFCYVMRGSSVMYTYMGQCAENVPLSSSSYSNTIGSIMSAAASIVGVASMAATGGATAPVAAGLLSGATTSTANAVSSLKPSVAHSGSIGGGAGIMGVNYPYLIFNTPHVSIPSQQRHYTGYPSNQIVKLSALKGFNVIQAINLSVSGANDSEMNEIESILKGGVIL